MSKEDYAEEIKRHTYFYFQGRDEERKRILKLIDEKIKDVDSKYWMGKSIRQAKINSLEELKEELEK